MMHSCSHHPRKLSPDYQYFCLNWSMSDERISANGWLWGPIHTQNSFCHYWPRKGQRLCRCWDLPTEKVLCISLQVCVSLYEHVWDSTPRPPTHTLPPPLGWWLRVKTKGKINLPLGQENDNFSQELTLHRVKKSRIIVTRCYIYMEFSPWLGSPAWERTVQYTFTARFAVTW